MFKLKKGFIALAIVTLGLLCGCQSSSKNQLRVAATSVPHAEILENVQGELEKDGVYLKIVIIDDFNTPNRALNDKEVDANFFQHESFLENQKKEFGYKLENYAKIHVEPMGIYSFQIDKLNKLKEGSRVGLPVDVANQARALILLQDKGLIKLKKSGPDVTLQDISENPKHLKFMEIDCALLPRTLDDLCLAAITTNFALQAGLSPKEESLAIEGADSSYVNILVIREGEGDRKDLQALKRALTSEKTRQFITKKYKGAVLPAF